MKIWRLSDRLPRDLHYIAVPGATHVSWIRYSLTHWQALRLNNSNHPMMSLAAQNGIPCDLYVNSLSPMTSACLSGTHLPGNSDSATGTLVRVDDVHTIIIACDRQGPSCAMMQS
ncbi:hypothetical protein RRG08_002159 [Elysia crispata]|uniref:Uncharacterized protein n=1 Tax=Elysia crispata TaxID=231223 RepID=A0AAE1DDZ7_9GAST|nr:hypothetical protein RRG08_002159 [Elysia crispata]